MIVRYTKDKCGVIDELVARSADVHLEKLDKKHWMLIVECGNERVHLTVKDVVEFEVDGVASTPIGEY